MNDHPNDLATRVYVNRNLRFDAMAWVGFDMDYTLARYKQDAIDRLSIDATLAKLLDKGYPESLRMARFDIDFAIRGLHVDRQLGHVLKMDRYRYVKRAFHGTREVSASDRKRSYQSKPVVAGSGRFHWVDTLYALPEVALFAGAVDHLEALGRTPDYAKLFDDIRTSIDLAHQDGSINGVIEKDFDRYVERDPELGPCLERLREGGKRLFLLTNSRGPYTHRMMTYLVGPRWKEQFEIVIGFARKPSFFEDTKKPFTVLDANFEAESTSAELIPGRVHEGGCIAGLEKALGVGGDEVLYVGDHIYGDVVRAKKESAWRTMMIVQEMRAELAAMQRARSRTVLLDALDTAIHALQDQLAAGERRSSPDPATLDELRAELKDLEARHTMLEDRIDLSFHPIWGPLFKAGGEVSSFGDQVERFACLYTERVSNLGRYAANHYFRGPHDRMPHER